MKVIRCICALLLALLASWSTAKSMDWLEQVPTRDHQKTNPYRGREDAVKAGRLLFLEHCAQCHGIEGQGKGAKPPLRTQRVESQASEGDLHWFLINGNVRHGMPSWSKLPDPQLWQLVSYLKSLH